MASWHNPCRAAVTRHAGEPTHPLVLRLTTKVIALAGAARQALSPPSSAASDFLVIRSRRDQFDQDDQNRSQMEAVCLNLILRVDKPARSEQVSVSFGYVGL
jgi:hypothetical protein